MKKMKIKHNIHPMKRLLSIAVISLVTIMTIGQVPEGFQYQTIVRNPGDNSVMANTNLNVTMRIIENGQAGYVTVVEEIGDYITNSYGLLSIQFESGGLLDLDWATKMYLLEIVIDGTSLGMSEIVSVPYALVAQEVINNDDADADPTNEIQDLQLVDNKLSVTGNPAATSIDIPLAGESQWAVSGDTLSIINKNIGIGTTAPGGKLVVMGDGTETSEDALFEVKRSDGQTVFAVYNDGAELLVDDTQSGGSNGGFTVGGYNPATQTVTNEYLKITPDSARIYVDNSASKGIKGGFAVGGYNASKGDLSYFTSLTPENYFIGHESGKKIQTAVGSGSYNCTFGYQTGMELTEGLSNIFIGYQSGMNTNTGSENIFIGYKAGITNTEGSYNLFLGNHAGESNTTGFENMFLGHMAGFSNIDGIGNLFLGHQAGKSNTEGEFNLFIGTDAGLANVSGNGNLFMGPGSGSSNTIGNYNLFIGNQAGHSNISGERNLFFGNNTGSSNIIGYANIFIGNETGQSNVSGGSNIFLGNNVGSIDAESMRNIMIGNSAGSNYADGDDNIILGNSSGFQGSGSDNIYIGNKVGYNNHGDGNIFIGNVSHEDLQNISNTLIIDDTLRTTVEESFIYGDFSNWYLRLNSRVGILREPLVNALEVNGDASKNTAGAWLANSDMRIKHEVRDIEDACDVIMKLHPVTFRYTSEYREMHPEIEDRVYHNFIAQEYKEVFPESVKSSGEVLESANDEILQMDSYNAQIYAIKAIQELIIENEKQDEQITELEKILEQLK